jgi:aminobenzoyl-glutamate transport protein
MDQPGGTARRSAGYRVLDWIERAGNRLPDPVTLFILGAGIVLVGSHLAVVWGWEVAHPTRAGETVGARSLLVGEGLRWVWLHLVENFTSFHPLGVVLVAMIGIGVAERTGLIGALLKIMVVLTPRSLLTPAVVFVGVMSSMAADAGYVVLPPLAALVFAKAGRSPMVGLAAVFAGVAAGFSANLLPTALDALLQGLTQEAAQLLDRTYFVDVTCNYFFMIGSTVVLTLAGWAVTRWLVEPRFTPDDIRTQVAAADLGAMLDGGDADRLTAPEKRGLAWAALTLLIAGAGVLLLVIVPGAPLHGAYPKPPTGRMTTVWTDVIVPIIFVLFLLPGIAYGLAARTLRNDRDMAHMMGATMASMGTYVVLAFFAGQFVAWFRESNLGLLLAVEGVTFLREFDLPPVGLVVAVILLVTFLNLFLGSASAKWALIAPVFVPLLMGLGISPELTQAAYRVGDSCTNAIAPLNPYLIVILVFMQKYMPRAGLGSLIALMLPYTLTFLVVWTALLLAWMALGVPLGPGGVPTFVEPIGAAG